ncbi:hypothetical protein AAMO2058_000711100 [Amorphochlora amoebiformis]
MKKGARHCRVLSFRAQRSVCFVRIETEILTQTTKAMQPRNSAEKLNSTSTRQRRLLDATVQEHPTLACWLKPKQLHLKSFIRIPQTLTNSQLRSSAHRRFPAGLSGRRGDLELCATA